MLAGLAIIVTLARLLGALFRRIGQPAVVGEILAGVVLGPTFFGAGLAEHLFPTVQVRPALGGLANVGLVLFMFVVGYELDTSLMRSQGRAAVTISLCSIIAALGLGTALGFWLAGQQHFARHLPFALFIGVAMSITAFPVLARILTDRGMQRTKLGNLSLSSAAIGDVTAWIMLAAVLIIAKSSAASQWRILLVIPYVLVIFFAVRPLLGWLARRRNKAGRLSPDILAVILVGLVLSGYATQWMGLHYIFGAFLFGVLMPRAEAQQMRQEILERLEQLSVLLLLPVYFVMAGLTVDLAGFGTQSAEDLALILAAAIVGKFAGAYLGGRLQGIGNRQAGALAVLMNTRGLTEIVILTVGLQVGILNVPMYSLMVIMALVTTAMTGPVMQLLYPKRQPYTFTPGSDSETGSGSLVITSPAAATSNKAAFSLKCTAGQQIAATLTSSPTSPATFPCGAAIPGFTVTGAITATQAADVTYHWARSNGSTTAAATFSIAAGQTVDVSDLWTPSASPFNGTDTLDITAPTAVSTPIPLALSCTGSHVTGISISAGTPDFGDGSATDTFIVTITTDGTSPVTLSWTTSQNDQAAPGPFDVQNGSKTVSGATTYTVDVTGTFSPSCDGGNPYYWALAATATGTDGHAASKVSTVNVTGNCD